VERRRATTLAALALAFALPFVAAPLLAPSPPLAAREAARPGFVGSATCAGCHAAQHADWQASDHARAMQPATRESVLAPFAGELVTAGASRAAFRRDGAAFIARTDGPDGAEGDFAVTETFGLDPLQQYLVLMPDGRRQPLPWAWDSRPRAAGGQRWFHLMADAPPRAGDPLHWTGREQNWNFMCAACHSTGLVRGYDAAQDRYDTRWTEIAVGCEACHGPGARHVAWARDGAAPGVANRGLATALSDRSGGGWRFADGDARGIARWEGPPRQAGPGVETCAPCHARARPLVADPPPASRFLDTHAPLLLVQGEYHADGQIQGEVFEWGSFAHSRMQRAGVVCADCHQPHSARLRAEGNAVCAQCHLPTRFEATAHHGHAPGSEGARCAACHMPAVTYMGVDRRRDHAFSVPRPDVAAAVGAPDACTACHAGQTQAWAAERLAEWHGPPRGAPHPALAIHAGRTRARGADEALSRLALDRAQPAILRATALSLLTPPATRAVGEAVGGTLLDPEPLVRAAALRALDALPAQNRLHAVRLLADEVRLVRIEAARALAALPERALPAAAQPAFARAFEELLASERVAAERPEAQVNIAGLLAQRGDLAGAEAAYRRALVLDPGFLPALVNQAGFEEARGRPAAAEALLRRAVAAHPTDGEPLYALALLQARRGRTEEAAATLAEAASRAPGEPRFAYAWALALHRLGRVDDAVAVLARHPTHRDSLVALAAFERDRGRLEAAARHAAAALALDPGDREAAAMLEQLRRAAATPR
jgi:predicted CXXCH cytochrome family protein